MNYLPLMTEEEVQYICSVIPKNDTIIYFQHNPKEFAKICPGFRARSISRFNISKLLFRYHNRSFISFFIENQIRDWLSQIEDHVEKCIENGDSIDLAYINTLPFSFFADNVALYFKLIGEEPTEEYIAILVSAVRVVKKVIEEQDKLKATLKSKEVDVNQLKLDLNSSILELKNTEVKLKKSLAEIKALKRTIAELGKLKTDVLNSEEVITTLRTKVQQQEETIQGLRAELSISKDNRKQLEAQINAELENQHAEKFAKQKAAQSMCPKNMDEFKDYLGYNLENIGLSTASEYYSLLKEYLSYILFQGIPILINRNVGITLMKCVANTIIGTPDVNILVFKNDISEQEIDEFLSSGKRIVCLDNFIGNYNETKLLPLFDNHKNKIIFLTIAYDRTLSFVPDEFLKYCSYLNLNRIGALTRKVELTEDPSTIEEIEAVSQRIKTDLRYSSLLREILGEFSVSQNLIEHKCAYITNEQDLCGALAFDILPYCIDVMQISPYNTSERLIKYVGRSGRCKYKNLFKGWFV